MSANKSKGPIIELGLCRCCGSTKKCRFLNVEYESLGQKEVYTDMMMECFGFLLSHLDGKPMERLVCATCVVRLREACQFKQQVLRCEEAFLQMKMYDKDEIPTNKETPVTVTVKVEEFKESEEHYSAGDDDIDDSIQTESDNEKVKMETNEDSTSNDDIPILQRFGNKKTVAFPLTIPKKLENKITKTKTKKSNKISKKSTSNNCDSVSLKNAVPMTKLQQMHREKDKTYISESNIYTIVENSYVCPFKCRHNHLICYYCGNLCTDAANLRSHTSSEHHPNKFKMTERKMIKVDISRIDCRLCDTAITNLDDFKNHITKVHSKKYYFQQPDSILPFRLTDSELKCTLCEQTFLYFHALNKHMNIHYNNFVCETCGLGFVDKHRFVMHQQRHEVGDFPCETCGKIFKAEYNRDLHIDRVHNKKGRVYCPKCDVKLMSYPQKLKHLVEVHGEEPLTFPCTTCDKVYMTRRMLTIHRRRDHLNDYRYGCQYCGQRFFTRFALNNHLPTHTGERNYKCKVCEKSYPRLKTLKDHMRIHTNDRRYRCHICGQAFIQNCSLKGHLKSQHPEYG